MDPIEKAIRAALEKGDQGNAAFRRRIYDSANAALLRSLSTKLELDDTSKQARLNRLSKIVTSIETEFTPASSVVPEYRAPIVKTRTAPVSEPTYTSDQNTNYDAPALDPRASGIRSSAQENDFDEPNTSIWRRLALVLVTIAIMVLLVLFGWTAWNSGAFDNSASTAAPDASAGPARLGSNLAADENWITVFEPTDVASVQVSDGLTAELQGAGAEAKLMIISDDKNSQSEASFEVGRGILETLRGKKVIFNIRAKTIDGANSQIAVTCSLAGLGDCQRLRFRLDGQLTENLVALQLADVAPEASGTLILAPNIDKTGNPVELISISVREDK